MDQPYLVCKEQSSKNKVDALRIKFICLNCFSRFSVFYFTCFLAGILNQKHWNTEYQQNNGTTRKIGTSVNRGNYRTLLFSVVCLTLALNSPLKIYSLILANKKLYYINIAKYAAEIAQFNKIFLLHILCVRTRPLFSEVRKNLYQSKKCLFCLSDFVITITVLTNRCNTKKSQEADLIKKS